MGLPRARNLVETCRAHGFPLNPLFPAPGISSCCFHLNKSSRTVGKSSICLWPYLTSPRCYGLHSHLSVLPGIHIQTRVPSHVRAVIIGSLFREAYSGDSRIRRNFGLMLMPIVQNFSIKMAWRFCKKLGWTRKINCSSEALEEVTW